MLSIKFKITFAAALILCLFLCLSLASASDVNSNETVSLTNDNTIKTTSNDNDIDALTASNSGEVLKEESKVLDISSLNRTIKSSSIEIKLENNYAFNETTDSAFIESGGIHITDHDLLIDGQGHTIDLGSKIRFLNVESRYIVLKNLNIINGYSQSSGGAIYMNESTCEIINCTFKDNLADNSGGAINIDHGTCIISNSTFINNTALSGSAGGANVDSGRGIVKNTTFINNHAKNSPATQGGGGTYGFTTILNCTYIGNSAKMGGAAYIEGAVENNVSILNTIFKDNTATEYGAAVFCDKNYDVYVIDCEFTNNNVTIYCGGALYIHTQHGDSNGTAYIINSNFTNNNANYSGGAIENTKVKTKIEKCIFINNNAALYGNAIDTDFQYNINTIIRNCIFIENTGNGTIIYTNNADNDGMNLTANNNIFLNHGESIIFAFKNPNNVSNIDFNWFGNDASNYADKPTFTNVNTTAWLFLNIIADPNEVEMGLTSKIKFMLYSYDGSTATPYDASDMTIKFNLAQTLGELDKKTAILGEEIIYTPKELGNASITGTYETESYTVNLKNINPKTSTSINIANETVDLKVDEEADTGATLNPADAGTLNYTSSNTNVAIVENGKIKAIGNGTAIITVSFAGNEQYRAAENKTITVTVSKIQTEILIQNTTIDMKIGDEIQPVISIMPSNAGELNYTSSDENIVKVDANGTITAINNGKANITISFAGNDKYAAAETKIITVSVKLPTEITVQNATIDMKCGDEYKPVVSINPPDVGELIYTSSDENVVKVDSNGTFIAIGSGKANVTISFAGNDQYLASKNTIAVTVTLKNASITVENTTLEIKYNETYDIVATTSPEGLTVSYTSSNETVATVDSNGKITAVGTGHAVITVSVGGDGIYALNSTTIDVHVKKELNINATTFAISGNATLIIFGLENATGNVTITIEGDNYTSSIMRGIVFVSLPQLDKNVTAYITYPGDDNYYNVSTTYYIIVKKNLNITISADPIYAGENATIILTGLENATGNITVMVGMSFTSVPIINCTATAITAALNETSTAMIIYMGDNNYNMVFTRGNITVLPKENLTINASANSIFIGEDGIIIVTGLENATGNVTVRAGNGIYFAKINNGTAKVIIPKMMQSLTAQVSYEGNNRYNPTNTTVDITVNKLATQITANSVNTKYEINKNIVITLKDAKGNPISGAKITVKLKKSITVKTDKNGKAKVSTKGLTPKTYTAKITFAGDDKYLKSNKNVKVVVKKAPSKLVAKKKTYKSKTKKKKYNVVLKNSKGKGIKKAKIIIKIKGKKYAKKTNSKGVATFNLKLSKGKYKVAIAFAGNTCYTKAKTIKSKVIVK